MRQRRVKPKTRKPRFFWQGVLILAPMLVLATLGAIALLQDKRMAEHEAQLRAQDVAEEVAANWFSSGPPIHLRKGTLCT